MQSTYIFSLLLAASSVMATHVSGYADCYNPANPDCWVSCNANHYKWTVFQCGKNPVNNDSFTSIRVTYEGQGVQARTNSDCTGDTVGRYTSSGCYDLSTEVVNCIWIQC